MHVLNSLGNHYGQILDIFFLNNLIVLIKEFDYIHLHDVGNNANLEWLNDQITERNDENVIQWT